MGIITLEDIIEKIMGTDLHDETDGQGNIQLNNFINKAKENRDVGVKLLNQLLLYAIILISAIQISLD